MRKLVCVASCVVAMLALVAAQERPPSQSPQTKEPIQGPSFRTGIDLVAVDVSVVDQNGRPVDDLLPPDFVVKIDGVVRRVASADLVKVDVEAGRRPQPQVDKTESLYSSNLGPPKGRRIVLAIDQVRIGPGSLRPVLDAASAFLDRLTPLDQVSLVAFPDPGVRVDFTNDKVRLRRALQRLVGHPQRSTTRPHSISLSEALAIDRGDQFVYNDVVERECRASREERENARCLRDIERESAEVVQEAQDDADNSTRGLRQLLEQLTRVEGPKLMILLSEGFLADEVEQRSIVTLAGEARTSINVMVVDLRQADVTVRTRRPNEAQDRRLNVQSLEGLAAMSRGSLFRIAGSGEQVFDRLASEISAYYILGVEQQPSDSSGNRHRIDVEVKRRDVTIRSRQAFVLSPARLAGRAREKPEAALRETLSSPFAVSGLPLRATTFAQQDPESGKVRLVVAAQVGEAGAKPGDYTVGYIVMNNEGQVAASFLERMTLSPGSGSPNEPLRFVGGVVVDPGTYSLRLAVVDQEGRRGSIVRDVSAWKMAGEPFALGDLVVGPVPPQGKGIAVQVEPYVGTDGVAAYIELYSTTEANWKGTTVAFEIADSEDAPALATLDASVEPGRQPTWRVATGVVPAKALPPGRYVTRAKIARDGTAVGVLVRPFVLEREAGAAAAPAGGIAVALSAVTPSLPKFDRAVALERDLLDAMLVMVERHSPDLKTSLVEARAGRYDAAAREAFNSGDLIIGAFLSGVDLFSKGELDEAAQQLQAAAGPRREFFPAAFFLGACYAAVGRDQDAAGVWQLALGKEPRPLVAYTVAADARLRIGQSQSAIDILKPAYDRDPTQDEIARRLAMAYAMTNRHPEALTVLDEYLRRHPDDQDMLYAAIASQYEAVRSGQILSNIDRDKVHGYAAAYRGPHRTLVDKYLETIK